MGDGFHLPLVQHQGRLNKRLAVACGTGVDDLRRGGKKTVNLFDSPESGFEGAAIIIAVEGIKQRAVFAHQGRLCGGGTGVDAQKAVSLVAFQVAGHHIVLVLPLDESVIIFLGGKQRIHTGNLKFHLDGGGEFFYHCAERNGYLLLVIHRRADGGEKMGVFRGDGVVVIQLQGPDEGGLQLGQKVQRPSQEGYVSPDGFSAGQAADGLVYHSLENGGREVFLCSSLVDQGLDVGFGEHTAAGGNIVE